MMNDDLKHERSDRLAMAERPIVPDLVSPVRAIRPGGTGGLTVQYGKVIRGLSYPDAARQPDADPPPEGYGEYLIRLVDDATPFWDAQTAYLIDQFVIYQQTNKKYKSLTGTPENPNIGNSPPNSPSQWELVDDIKPHHFEFGIISDWRNFVPWYAKDAVVPLLQKDEHYYFWQQMTRVASPTSAGQSIMWNETDKRLMAVFV